jgi:hypothetical protein
MRAEQFWADLQRIVGVISPFHSLTAVGQLANPQ